MHMIVEQTYKYPYRMVYDEKTNTFNESKDKSLLYENKMIYPYGWIKETGTPPSIHFDCILVTNICYELGECIEVKIIGAYKRNDGDHKFIVIDVNSKINNYDDLSLTQKSILNKLYINKKDNEEWVNSYNAMQLFNNSSKTL